ncbi:hypothetical protein IAQ61_011294 [Plenodomus lingam]|uniref:Predicted protein n=1 Tax=Leptosphaeria maculans (strain JN3 / isolate v23.1.3 / race Av1-4-5-6-7-8) TaxID=985895 RepID=E5A9M1_LEPMJ|nr:predicted protein [Plenodomus lingam JN3]KAH9859513.1 hypothetical protein IAQ61_011294 [Plenodomus lingam]CBY00362.1 predicted protein [Plenodomus lingam JN3]
MDRPRREILGKRAQRVALPEEAVEASGRRVSRRTRAKTEANETKQRSTATRPEPWTTRLRSGLLTPQTSNPSEKDVASDNNTLTRCPPNTFPFMKLPAELRINVYHKALVRDEPLILHAERAPDKSDDEAAPSNSSNSNQGRKSNSNHSSNSNNNNNNNNKTLWPRPPPRPQPRPVPRTPSAIPERRPLRDPISPQLLRVNSVIYKEARQVLYSDNVFTLSLLSGIHTLSTLHQRSRSLIKHVTLTIPSHHDILDGFADLVRLGLRYCWGLKTFRIVLHASLPDYGGVSGATSVYANAFHILRWLPRGCSVVLEGNVSESVRRVVAEEGRLQNMLDETSYLRRQHQMPERH